MGGGGATGRPGTEGQALVASALATLAAAERAAVRSAVSHRSDLSSRLAPEQRVFAQNGCHCSGTPGRCSWPFSAAPSLCTPIAGIESIPFAGRDGDESRYTFALACLELGKVQEALAALLKDQDPRAVPNGAAGLYLTGRAYLLANDSSSAGRFFETALRVDPTMWAAYSELCALHSVERINRHRARLEGATKWDASSSQTAPEPGRIDPFTPEDSKPAAAGGAELPGRPAAPVKSRLGARPLQTPAERVRAAVETLEPDLSHGINDQSDEATPAAAPVRIGRSMTRAGGLNFVPACQCCRTISTVDEWMRCSAADVNEVAKCLREGGNRRSPVARKQLWRSLSHESLLLERPIPTQISSSGALDYATPASDDAGANDSFGVDGKATREERANSTVRWPRANHWRSGEIRVAMRTVESDADGVPPVEHLFFSANALVLHSSRFSLCRVSDRARSSAGGSSTSAVHVYPNGAGHVQRS